MGDLPRLRGWLLRRRAREPGQGVDAAADKLAIGRHPVIGQTVPRRKGQHLDFGIEERQSRGKPRHSPIVAADMQPAPCRPPDDQAADYRRIVAFGCAIQCDRARPRLQRSGEVFDRRCSAGPGCPRHSRRRRGEFRIAHPGDAAPRNASNSRITSWSCAAGGAVRRLTQSNRSASSHSSNASKRSSWPSSNASRWASAKRPRIRSVSRVPRCHDRNNRRLRRRSVGAGTGRSWRCRDMDIEITGRAVSSNDGLVNLLCVPPSSTGCLRR